MQWKGSAVNAVTNINYIPGMQIIGTRGTPTPTSPNEVRVNDYRFNWNVGLNLLHYFAHHVFSYVGAGMGITMWHADAEFFEDTGSDTAVDHPGTTVAKPIVNVQLGLGCDLTKKSQIILFGSASYMLSSVNQVLASQADSEGHAVVSPGRYWFSFGAKITRAISL